MMRVMLVLALILGGREALDPHPPEPKPVSGCQVVVTSAGAVVICR